MNSAKEATLKTIKYWSIAGILLFGGDAIYTSSNISVPIAKEYQINKKENFRDLGRAATSGLIAYGFMIPVALTTLGLSYRKKEEE